MKAVGNTFFNFQDFPQTWVVCECFDFFNSWIDTCRRLSTCIYASHGRWGGEFVRVFTPPEGLKKVLGGEVLPIIQTPESIFELFSIDFLNFFCDKIQIVFFWNWFRGLNSKPLCITQGCGQKFIPVYKVPVGNWIRGQNPDLLLMVAVKNWYQYTARLLSKIDSGIHDSINKPNPGSKPRSVRMGAVKNLFRYTAGFRSKMESGIHGCSRKLNPGSIP